MGTHKLTYTCVYQQSNNGSYRKYILADVFAGYDGSPLTPTFETFQLKNTVAKVSHQMTNIQVCESTKVAFSSLSM